VDDGEETDDTPAASVGPKCGAAEITALSVGGHLVRQGSGDVAAGAEAHFGCNGATKILMSSGDTSGRFVADQKFSVTCNGDGTAFTGSPTSWGDCLDVSAQQCSLAPPDGSKGYNSATTPANADLGATYTVSCATAGHVVSGTTSGDLSLTCTAASSDTAPFYEVRLNPAFPLDNLVAVKVHARQRGLADVRGPDD